MADQPQTANNTGVAKLTNVGLALSAMKQITNASHEVPRIAALTGPTGFGKTRAATHLAHRFGADAIYVEIGPFENANSLARLLLKELDVRAPASAQLDRMVELILTRVQALGRPLVFDEVDHIAGKRAIELIRTIHDKVGCPILLIGEEQLRAKLLRHHERFHDRVLTWVEAVPNDVDDARKLAAHHAPELRFGAGALEIITSNARGSARRITTELLRLREALKRTGATEVTEEMLQAGGKRGAR